MTEDTRPQWLKEYNADPIAYKKKAKERHRKEREALKDSISPYIQKILDTEYIFEGPHAKVMKKFTYQQASKYMITRYEDELLKNKFDQVSHCGKSYYVESGVTESGRVRYIEKNDSMDKYG